eukprot:CAMPEP_0182618296 /NCGR_PEP_ID=MMETSP1330-20130603/45339_1 /TAXON_ID=464278 /ORGANISM="Picochlorum sp., Strain RCC944" /LENGTH=62 /DNA_ID=CAMNT_0024838513 /DNA_START=58 /DNA_END=246 /DNA_ORIENTATION=-
MDRVKGIQSVVQKSKREGKYIHMVPKNAYVTSVAIPLFFVVTAGAFLSKGIYNMATGTGKVE